MQSTKTILSLASIAVLAAGLTGCASDPYYGANNYPAGQYSTVNTVSSAPMNGVEYGRITDVTLVSSAPQTSRANSATGTVVGAVVGGALGTLVGGGSGRVLATVLGAVGGAVVGNRLANNDGQLRASNDAPVYRLTVTTDQGNYRQFEVSASADLRVGDRVRIENGVIYQG
ncbi:MAG: glycine zipper 2TM domain-containing protein [Ramlibacter sp.]|nr:glycine zipper 2TM domain-containing protein [Ramlibacter sp.]